MAAHGVNPYADLGEGAVSTWLYGPVPLWAWWPATLAPTAASAIVGGAGLNAFYLLGGIVCCCWLWPDVGTAGNRILGGATIVALWPAGAFEYLTSDNLGVALALVANTLLVRSLAHPRPALSWLAAFLSAAAVGSKQTLAALLFAQVLWLWLETGPKPALAYLLRVATMGGVLLVLMINQFGLVGPWRSMVDLPRHFPWTISPEERLLDFAPQIFLQIVAPALVLVAWHRPLRSAGHPLRLPFFAWLACLPLDLGGILGTGGAPNSLHGFALWAPPVIVWGLAKLDWSVVKKSAAASLAGAGVVAFFWTREVNRPFWPITFHLNQAAELCRTSPAEIWFPWNPTVAFYSEHRFYHAEDGLYARAAAGRSMTYQQWKEGLPAQLRFIALHGKSWGIALTLTDQKPLAPQPGVSWQIYPVRRLP